ncbi:hypothetical protein H072_11059 [Dactylellina haptotyla CBS 200.50]|uniref:Yeast cell wall synthesis Kre9/Knh1-like N-terminal domain-containing protein n=1 Tax=Dactylellina haptotyla (strain CBS 200.50) TaxID=1284197 RepID=S8A2Y4_DACHA|nr:hypothetical protein H072_11059 [Dactylellina haptotyla CBS 200.50]
MRAIFANPHSFTYLFFSLSLFWAGSEAKGNLITSPKAGDVIKDGSTFDIKWNTQVGDSVQIYLISPPNPWWPADWKESQPDPISIAPPVPNKGHFQWKVDVSHKGLRPANGYQIRIQYDNNPENWSVSGNFTLDIPNDIGSPVSLPLPTATSTDTDPGAAAIIPVFLSLILSAFLQGPSPSVYVAPQTGTMIILGDPPTIIAPGTTFLLTPTSTSTQVQSTSASQSIPRSSSGMITSTATSTGASRSDMTEIPKSTAVPVNNLGSISKPCGYLLYGSVVTLAVLGVVGV